MKSVRYEEAHWWLCIKLKVVGRSFWRKSFKPITWGPASFPSWRDGKQQETLPEGEWSFWGAKQHAFWPVKVVILGQDPYHGPGQAHGLSFRFLEGSRAASCRISVANLNRIWMFEHSAVSELGSTRGATSVIGSDSECEPQPSKPGLGTLFDRIGYAAGMKIWCSSLRKYEKGAVIGERRRVHLKLTLAFVCLPGFFGCGQHTKTNALPQNRDPSIGSCLSDSSLGYCQLSLSRDRSVCSGLCFGESSCCPRCLMGYLIDVGRKMIPILGSSSGSPNDVLEAVISWRVCSKSDWTIRNIDYVMVPQPILMSPNPTCKARRNEQEVVDAVLREHTSQAAAKFIRKSVRPLAGLAE